MEWKLWEKKSNPGATALRGVGELVLNRRSRQGPQAVSVQSGKTENFAVGGKVEIGLKL